MEDNHQLFHWLKDGINEPLAFCRVETDSDGKPADFVFLDVNKSFIEVTGLKIEKITGKRVTEIFPGIHRADFDYVGEYGKLALRGGELNHEHFFEPTGSWYNVKAFSREPGYIALLFREIKDSRHLWDKREEAEILSILAESRELPWALQMVLLKILEITGFPAGAIRLINGDDYFYREHQGLDGTFLEGILKVSDNGSILIQDKSSGKKKHCILEHIAGKNNDVAGGVRKTFQGTLYAGNAEKLFKDNTLIPEDGNKYCSRCIAGGDNPYRTIVVVPLKALEKTIGLFYLLHNSPGFLEFNRVVHLESLISPIGYTIKHLQDQDHIQENEKRFRLLVQNARDIIFRFNLTPEITCDYISPVVEKMTGYKQEEFYKDPLTFIRIVHKDDRKLAESLFTLHKDDPARANNNTMTIRWVCGRETIWVELQVSISYEHENRKLSIEGIIRDVTERVETEKRLRDSREMINNLSIKLLHAYEQERARLARELHDEVGQALTAAKLDLQMLGSAIRKEMPSFDIPLSRTIKMINDTIVNVRKQVVHLRPPVLENVSLPELVKDMVKEMSLRGDFKAEVKITGEFNNGGLPHDVEVALYRCVQEAVTNVMRHARADNVLVEMKQSDNMIFLRVKDDGLGFNCIFPDISKGQVGLTGMRERVSLLGGDFTVLSEPGKGTEVGIQVPLNGNREV